MSEMKTYKGKVTSLQLYRTSDLGIRMWKVGFKTGTAYFYISRKKQMPFALGDTIRFRGDWSGGEIHKFFIINEVVDVNDCVQFELWQQQKLGQFIAEQA
jgi:hypothetical protein